MNLLSVYESTFDIDWDPPAHFGIMVFPASFWITTVIIAPPRQKAAAKSKASQRQRDVRREHGHMATAGRLAGQLRPS
ncbi:hypothetical protein KCP69_08020 [Salmonella enterica subsp. enterica]|nr:hypothetical protein KCP69_08020 [Salmonella enterica subsp. enterica]